MTEPKRRDEIQGDILHEYDGIEEADNHLPTWWLITFFGAVVFAIAYWFVYEGYGLAKSQSAIYAEEQAAIDEASGAHLTDADLEAVAANEARVSAGRAAFTQNCVVCHGERAEGKIGPNLTDGSWIHGARPTEIFGVIRRGVAAKGMPQWGTVLGPERTQSVVAYVLSIRNTNVPGKEPQGSPVAAP